MTVPRDHYHRGVTRVAGVVHVGPAGVQVREYLRDADGYANAGLRYAEHAARELRARLEQHDECARRSLLCAAVAMLTWGLS